MFLGGVFSFRCLRGVKVANGIFGMCNFDFDEGDIEFCDSGLCFGLGCVGFCKEDIDCVTYDGGCDGGKCKDDFDVFCMMDVDCSFWFCDKGYNIGGDENFIVNDICWFKSCGINVDCVDSDFFCIISNNGEINVDFFWEYLCIRVKDNVVSIGEECETDFTDNILFFVCGDGVCLNSGYCSLICNIDVDCVNDNIKMLCNQYVVGIDYDEDEVDDGVVFLLGLCFDFFGLQMVCTSNKDCIVEETCSYLMYFNVIGVFDVKGVCVIFEFGQGDIGDLCGGFMNVICKSGFCIGVDEINFGFCMGLCFGNDMCFQGVVFGGVTVYNFYCCIWMGNIGVSLEMVEDNVWLLFCWFTFVEVFLLTVCSVVDMLVCGANEVCMGWLVVMGVTGSVKIFFFCMGFYLEIIEVGLVFIIGEFGDVCDISGEAVNGVYCKSNYCL